MIVNSRDTKLLLLYLLTPIKELSGPEKYSNQNRTINYISIILLYQFYSVLDSPLNLNLVSYLSNL